MSHKTARYKQNTRHKKKLSEGSTNKKVFYEFKQDKKK